MALKLVLQTYAAGTLTYLDLNFNGYALTHLDLDFNGDGLDGNGRFVGSLRQLHALQHLRIQASMFINYASHQGDLPESVDLLPLLPASLETLTLLSAVEDILVMFTLYELSEKREEYLPNLKTFICGYLISVADDLVYDCASVGIDLIYGEGPENF